MARLLLYVWGVVWKFEREVEAHPVELESFLPKGNPLELLLNYFYTIYRPSDGRKEQQKLGVCFTLRLLMLNGRSVKIKEFC